MRPFLLSFFLLFSCLPSFYQISLTPNYSFDYQITSNEIQLTILAKNQGWVGFGFGLSMFYSEIFLCSYDSTSKPQLSHYNSRNETTPYLLNSQEVTLLSGFRNTTHTSCTFKRSLLGSSSGSFNVTTSNPINIIWAYGQSDALDYHTDRGQTNVSLFACGSYCQICNSENQTCLACIAPAVIIGSECQILLQIAQNYSLSYFIKNRTNVSFTITAKNQGYVALGLGNSMFKADIFFCNLTANSWKALEFKSTQEDTPSIDPIQNVELISASRNSTHTSCSFQRNLVTSDLSDTNITLDADFDIIYAYGSGDSLDYHDANRGASVIRIAQSLDFNNNGSLCLLGDQSSNCAQCKYGNFLPGTNGRCQENYIKDTLQIITPNVSLYYYVENNSTLSLTMTAKNQGWMAIGLGASMLQADIFMCHINSTSNQWEALELKSAVEDTPSLDKIQNLVLLFAYRNTTHTICSFQRELKTNDSNDTVISLGINTDLIYALGQTDKFDYHTFRGQFNMAFNNNSIPVCDDLCMECEADNLCSHCRYQNFMVVNGICVENFDLETSLLSTTNFSLFYYLYDENTIALTMISNQQGWLALGLVPDQNSLDDLIVCREQNNTSSVTKFKYNQTFIQEDEIQNVKLMKFSRNATHSICTVQRQLQTNESTDFQIKMNSKLKVIYGYDTSDVFVNFTEKGEGIALLSNSTCSNVLCSKCSADNTTCLECRYSNYLLGSGTCLENYNSEKMVALAADFNLFYYIDKDEISFSLVAQSQGYISIGLGSSMTGADVFMCNKSVDGVWNAYEMKSTGESRPKMDPTQDLTFLEASRNSTHTLCTFRRKLTSNDPTDKLIKVNEVNSIIYAIGAADAFHRHTERGSLSINFSNATGPSTCPSNCLKCDSNSQCISCLNSGFVVINGFCQINNISILPSSAIIMQSLILYWDFSPDNTSVTLMIKTTLAGYVALGIGKCMQSCDIHVIEYDQYSNVILRDMYSSADSGPPNDVDLGGTDDLTLLGYGMSDGYMHVKYQRKVNTGDKFDFSLEQGDQEMAYAFASGKTLQYHNDNRGRFMVHFVQGFNGGADIEDLNSLARIHGILLFVAWGGLIDVFLFFGRYLKTFKWYIEFHGVGLVTICILSTVLESLAIYKHREDLAHFETERTLAAAHFILGTVLMGLYCMEIFYGLIVRNLIEKKNKFINPTKHKLFHKINGILIYLISKANIGIGIQLFKQDLLIPLIIFYIVLFTVKGIIELIYQIQPNFLKTTPTLQQNLPLLMSDLVEKINKNVSREILLKEFPQFSWVILDTQIYDISGFTHPGGNYITEQIKGREIGRFFYGISGLETLPLQPYKHSIFAKNYLNSRLIGNIENSHESALVNKKNGGLISNNSAVWMITEKKELSATTCLFRFKTSQFAVRNYIKGVEWFGRHFTVQDAEENNKLTRLYTTVLCFSSQNSNIREKLIKVYEDLKNSKGAEANMKKKFTLSNVTKNSDITEGETEISPTSEELTLVIKKYNHPNAFSNYIHTHGKNNYIIRGNFGNGLELTKESSGNYYIFAGGTGILPFMDLMEYLLKKALFTSFSQSLEGEDLDQMNVYKEDYAGAFNNNFKLVLFGSFANDDEFLGSDIICKLFEVVKEKNYKWFDMKIRISDKNTKFKNIPLTKMYFDRNFLSENITNEENLKKIYVCGPPVMNKKMHEELINFGINETIIHFV